ncbi:MAG: class I SAM-dependent methyltransferase, partial [Planctomycetota bacterium]
MHADAQLWRQLTQPHLAPLVAAARDADPASPADVARLRKLAPQPLVHAALQLAAARRKAIAKLSAPTGSTFGDQAQHLLADPAAVEQATDPVAAAYKASRLRDAFRALPPDQQRPFVDLACGAGLDARALLDEGLPVLAIDADPTRCVMAQHNTARRAAVACADATQLNLHAHPFHLDPARRTAAGQRL